MRLQVNVSSPWSPCPCLVLHRPTTPQGCSCNWLQVTHQIPIYPKRPISAEMRDFERVSGLLSSPVSPARLLWARTNQAPWWHMVLTPAAAGSTVPWSPAGASDAPENSISSMAVSNTASPSFLGSSSAVTLQGQSQCQGGVRLRLSCHLCPTGPSAGSSGENSAAGPDPLPRLPGGGGRAALL